WLAGRWVVAMKNPPGHRLNAGNPPTLSAESIARTRLLSAFAMTSAVQYPPQKSRCQAPVKWKAPTKVCLARTR
ncbi:hypothetical protein MUP77_12535, partial [Candidatus Bathyarchaeota archaeon]|nr:hypothetical protein [Candidatus Bathyarchaeota archaeon]